MRRRLRFTTYGLAAERSGENGTAKLDDACVFIGGPGDWV